MFGVVVVCRSFDCLCLLTIRTDKMSRKRYLQNEASKRYRSRKKYESEHHANKMQVMEQENNYIKSQLGQAFLVVSNRMLYDDVVKVF